MKGKVAEAGADMGKGTKKERSKEKTEGNGCDRQASLGLFFCILQYRHITIVAYICM